MVELGSESEYKKCDISSAVNTMSSGNDVVKLNKAGTRYFTCGTAGHCGQGMKVKINVVAANTPSNSASSSSSSPASSASAASSSSQGLLVSFLLVFALLAMSLFALF